MISTDACTGGGSVQGRCRRSVGLGRLGLLLVGLVGFGPPAAAGAQETPRRGVFHLGVGNISFLNDWAPSLHVGYLLQFSIRKSQVTKDEFGFDEITPPRAYVHSMVSGGVGFNTDVSGSTGFAGYGQLGLLWRADRGLGPITVFGPVAQGSLGPNGVGAAVRGQLLAGNAAISLGWMWFDGPRNDGFTVSIDLLRCILQDLGLVQACLIT